MKKILTLTFFAAICMQHAQAQITITAADVPVSGKMIFQASDTTTPLTIGAINPGPSGANKVWDFSAILKSDQIDTLYMTNPAWLPHSASFPTSNLAVQFPGGMEYYLSNVSSGLFALGAYANFVSQSFMVVKFNPAEELTSFPNTYNSTFQNTSKIDVKIPYTATGVDSARFKEIKTKDVKTDGWGTTKTPLGTYNSIRQRGKVMTHDSIWLHVTFPLPTWTFLGETLDSAWHFSWWANSVGLPLVEFDSTHADTIANLTWLKTLPVAGAVHESTAFNGLSVYPNPNNGKVSISIPNTIKEATAELYTAKGEKVSSSSFVGGKDSPFDLSMLPNGVYYFRITSKEGTAVRKLVVNR